MKQIVTTEESRLGNYRRAPGHFGHHHAAASRAGISIFGSWPSDSNRGGDALRGRLVLQDD